MELEEYQDYVKQIKIGKTLPNSIYVHKSAIGDLPENLAALAIEKEGELNISQDRWNILKFYKKDYKLAYLNYPDFFDGAFPLLKESWCVDNEANTISFRTYEHSLNPPILHRKELLLSPDHPRSSEYSALTTSAEAIGLFDDTTRIGYQVQWKHLIREHGYELIGHQLIPFGNDVSVEDSEDISDDNKIRRHRTALVRYGFSAPIQSLARHGFLDDTVSIFDYGCGRGDDVRGLAENNINIAGWDPYYAPDNLIVEGDIVNLGFVINVIEDFDERVEALTRAYSLARRFLVVSVMLANENKASGKLFNDGVVTKRGTFQKYYTQGQFRVFLESVLDETPIAVGPGIYYIFRDKDAEQRFIANRYRSQRSLLRDPSYQAELAERKRVRRKEAVERLYIEHQSSLEKLWDECLSFGRKPNSAEIRIDEVLLEAFGSFNKAFRFISGRKDPTQLEKSRDIRISDVTVYLALRVFEQNKAYKNLEPGIKRDVKAFFGTIGAAKETAQQLLFQIGDTQTINMACKQAAERGLGQLIEGRSLQLHTSLVEQLPSILRVYCGCALALYGDYREADLLKIHIVSGKLTLMKFDDFEGKPIPRMIERVKLKLKEQDIVYFNYEEDGFEPPYLFLKSRFINEEFLNYPEQVEFDLQLESLNLFDFSGFGPTTNELHVALNKHRWSIDGFKLARSQTIPDMNEPCGNYLTYRDLIECGETQNRTKIPNIPKEPDTYSALLDLAISVLDPVIDYFGMVKLTYGFCSPELEKHIPKGIAPKLDQHASHEKRRTGNFVCDRLGAALDFVVEDENMIEVANWVIENTAYDRLYFYGSDLPIHVSYSTSPAKIVIDMSPNDEGKSFPRRVKPPLN